MMCVSGSFRFQHTTCIFFKYTYFHTTTSLYGISMILNRVAGIERSNDKKIKQELEKVTFLLKLRAEENG